MTTVAIQPVSVGISVVERTFETQVIFVTVGSVVSERGFGTEVEKRSFGSVVTRRGNEEMFDGNNS